MANNIFDREIINTRERPVSSDLNQEWSQEAQTLREILRLMNLSQDGFVGDAFYATATGNTLEVQLAAGIGFAFDAGQIASNIDGIPELNDLSSYIPLYLRNPQLITLAGQPGGGQERYDLIEVKNNRRRTDASSRDILNVSTGAFDATSVMKTLAFDMDGATGTVVSPASSTASISVKQGVVAATGAAVVPAVTSGYRAVAVCYVPGGAAPLMTNKIRDERRIIYGVGGTSHFGIDLSMTIGSPDALTLDRALPRPSSLRIGAVSQAGTSNAAVRIYFIHGSQSGRNMQGVSTPWRVSGGAPTNIVDKITNVTLNGALTGAEVTALGLAPSSLVVAAGQSYSSFDIQAESISGGSITDASVIRHMIRFFL